jgi:ABC-type proline/glycine betaine transport system ATPase subunit
MSLWQDETKLVKKGSMISWKNVSVQYPGIIALPPTTIDFSKGQFTVLWGRSGAGKSTLLRGLNLLTRPSSGNVWVEEWGALEGRRAIREHRRRTACAQFPSASWGSFLSRRREETSSAISLGKRLSLE